MGLSVLFSVIFSAQAMETSVGEVDGLTYEQRKDTIRSLLNRFKNTKNQTREDRLEFSRILKDMKDGLSKYSQKSFVIYGASQYTFPRSSNIKKSNITGDLTLMYNTPYTLDLDGKYIKKGTFSENSLNQAYIGYDESRDINVITIPGISNTSVAKGNKVSLNNVLKRINSIYQAN